MKKITASALFVFITSMAMATPKDSTINFDLPDSVKAIQFYTEVNISTKESAKWFSAGIKTDACRLYLSNHKKNGRAVIFQMHEFSRPLSNGLNVKNSNWGGYEFKYNWKDDTDYKLLISIASDSSSGICIYSGYIFLANENKWKLIGTRKHPFNRFEMLEPSAFINKTKKTKAFLNIKNIWVQTNKGAWKNLKDSTTQISSINLFNHVDSLQQSQIEQKQIEDYIKKNNTAYKHKEGIYYQILQEGNGEKVNATDTVTIHYKGYLFSDGSIFDQTKDKPATFPLSRLIKGWQIAVPECRVGGKILIVIPSGLGYSIRTRAAKIPPNSILAFEIEVLKTQAAEK